MQCLYLQGSIENIFVLINMDFFHIINISVSKR